MSRRRALLEKLINFEHSLDETLCSLSDFPWDSDVELVLIERAHLCSVLFRFLEQTLSSSELEGWANAIESREDIGFDEQFKNLIADVIFELANPLLTESLTQDRAKELIVTLGCDADDKAAGDE